MNNGLYALRACYRYQHDVMARKHIKQMGVNSIMLTTRRQSQFRPRGNVYKRLLKLEIGVKS